MHTENAEKNTQTCLLTPIYNLEISVRQSNYHQPSGNNVFVEVCKIPPSSILDQLQNKSIMDSLHLLTILFILIVINVPSKSLLNVRGKKGRVSLKIKDLRRKLVLF